MNQAARDILIEAELLGHRQNRHTFHDTDGSDCALGVLHLRMHQTRQEAMHADGSWWRRAPAAIFCVTVRLGRRYRMGLREMAAVSYANDKQRLTFGQIAAKYGDCPPVEPRVPVAEVVAG